MACSVRNPLSVRLLLMLAGTVWCTYAVTTQQWDGLLPGILLLSASYCLYRRMLCRQREHIDLVVEAIANNDYAFRLPSRCYGDATVGIFNDAANRMGSLIAWEKQNLLAREKYYEIILQHVNTGVVVMDTDQNKVIMNNESALRLLNIPRLDRLDQLPEDRNDVKDCLLTLQPGDNGNLVVNMRQGTSQLLVRVVSVVLNDRPLRIFTLNDVRHVLDEYEVDAWMKLTRVLVHEIMNGVTPVCSLSSSMLAKPSLPPDQLHAGLAAIHATSQGLLNLVENYRRFTSLPKPNPSVLVLSDLLTEVEALQFIPPAIRLTVKVQPEDVMVYADRHLIRQVFVNLLRNAVQAIGETEGRIDITAMLAENEHVFVYVSNSGPCISDEDADQLFVPFYTTKNEGSGIGLSVSRQIMVQSNGNITLLPPGTRGWNTTFLVEFC